MNATLQAAPAADFKIGIRQGISRADYDAVKAVNQSTLKHFRRSAAHAHEAMMRPDESSVSQELGTAIHTSLLEPVKFHDNFIVMPDFTIGLVDDKGQPYASPRATKKYKQMVLEFEADNKGRTVIDSRDKAICDGIAEGIAASKTASDLLTSKGSNELGVFWRDAETGLACKGLVDRVTSFEGVTTVVDIKSCQNASRFAFERDAFSYGYYLQASFYLAGLHALAPAMRRFVFIAVETQAPYCCAVYELDFESLAQGQVDLREFLDEYHTCQELGAWPGYDDGVTPISLPRYAFSKEGNAHVE